MTRTLLATFGFFLPLRAKGHFSPQSPPRVAVGGIGNIRDQGLIRRHASMPWDAGDFGHEDGGEYDEVNGGEHPHGHSDNF